MKVKLDENLPIALVDRLTTLGHDVATVTAEHLSGHPDNDVWHTAQQDVRFLITQDLDFSDIRQYRPGTHAGLLLIRLMKPGRKVLLERVHQLFLTEETVNWRGCFIVATEVKLRIHRTT